MVSSIDDELKLNSGRPPGGIGIMWRKHMNKHCTFKTYNCNRITGLEINCGSFKALFLCVCVPCDSSENYDDFMFYLSKLLQIADEFHSRTSLFVEILTLIYNSHRDSAKNLLMFVMLIPYVFQIRCCCRRTRILLSVLVIQLRHGLIISCPPLQDIPYYRMSMLREITFLQILTIPVGYFPGYK